jgi:hypothetical protein
MAVGVLKKFKYPLGYTLTSSVMKSDEILEIISVSIKEMEEAGFSVLGLTTDQGSNFEKTFKFLGVTPEKPKFKLGTKYYFVLRDPPHLIKNARNFLERGAVKVPGSPGKAKWEHIQQLYDKDSQASLRIVPKLTEQHISGLKFAQRMKVKLATSVLSHSVAAGLSFMVATNTINSAAIATSEYCVKFNRIFDCLNSSSPKATVASRRPLHQQSDSIQFLQEAN